MIVLGTIDSSLFSYIEFTLFIMFVGHFQLFDKTFSFRLLFFLYASDNRRTFKVTFFTQSSRFAVQSVRKKRAAIKHIKYLLRFACYSQFSEMVVLLSCNCRWNKTLKLLLVKAFALESYDDF